MRVGGKMLKYILLLVRRLEGVHHLVFGCCWCSVPIEKRSRTVEKIAFLRHLFFLLVFIMLMLAASTRRWRVFKTTAVRIHTALALIALPTRATRQVLLLIIDLNFILVTVPARWLHQQHIILLFIFIFFFISTIPPVSPPGEPVEPSEVIIVAIVPPRPDILRFLDLKCQATGDTLQVDVLWLTVADELLSDYNLGLKILLLRQQVVFAFYQLVKLFLHRVFAVFEFY